MPDLNTTRQVIESYVSTNIDGTIVDIAYENTSFNTTGVSVYAHMAVQFVYSDNVNIAGVNQKRIRHEGAIIFKLYTPIDSGTANSLAILDSIKTQVQNKYLSSNLLTYVAEPNREGVGADGYYTNFLRIPFVSDEC